MASGLPWEEYVEKAAACPQEWPFGTKVVLDDQEWICLDRGGKVVCDASKGACWVDFLTRSPKYRYGSLVNVNVVFP